MYISQYVNVNCELSLQWFLILFPFHQTSLRCNANSTFRGPTCEDCPTCTGTCKKYRDCVQCRAFRGAPRMPEECSIAGERDCHFQMDILPDPVEVRWVVVVRRRRRRR